MKLAVMLALGDSLDNMSKTGQSVRFINYYIKNYAKYFDEVIVFSYKNEDVKGLPKNVTIVPNKHNVHRYLYGILLSFIHIRTLRHINVIRAFHLSGSVPAIVAKIFFGKPFIFNYAYSYKKFAVLEGKNLHAFLIRPLKFLAFILASVIFVANKAESPLGGKKIYLPNGVDIKLFKPKNKSVKKKDILSVGRLEKQKNLQLLIKAMAKNKFSLTLVGNGKEKKSIKKLAISKGVKVKFIDMIENTHMPRLFQSALIYVQPSLIEGSPKTIIEAMACGCPVIALRNTEMAEIIKDGYNGVLVKNDYIQLQNKIVELTANPSLMNKLAKNARNSVVKNHNFQTLLNTEIKHLIHIGGND